MNPSSRAAAACVSKAKTPVRVGHISGVSGARPASAACQAGNPGNFAGDTARGNPPLIWHGGAVMGRLRRARWSLRHLLGPAGPPEAASYQNLITQYLNDVAAASGSTSNVYSILPEYSGSDGSIRYDIQAGSPIIDANPLPANGCTMTHKDTTAIYADGSGYNACLDDAQVQAQANTVVAAQKLPVNLSHIYVMYLPQACRGLL